VRLESRDKFVSSFVGEEEPATIDLDYLGDTGIRLFSQYAQEGSKNTSSVPQTTRGDGESGEFRTPQGSGYRPDKLRPGLR
jgi:hypothetical protein